MDFDYVPPLEKSILSDIETRTGLAFRRVQAIPTQDERTASLILPILKNWVGVLKEANYRHTIYYVFGTPFAAPYMDDLIAWWQTETDELASGCLTHVIALVAQPQHAERLWKLCQELPPRPFHYLLLAKLATFASVQDEVKNTLVEALYARAFEPGDLEAIARVDDPRIREWFATQVEASHPVIRSIARRVVERGKRLPRGMMYADRAPDRLQELFSTEVDCEEASSLLTDLSKRLGLRIPAAIRKAGFLDRLELDRWAVVSILNESGGVAGLWFRLEDADIVEIVVAPEEIERTLKQ